MTVLRTAYVKVKPDTDGFDGELKRRLRRIDTSGHGKNAGKSFGDGLAKGFNERGGVFAKVVATSAARLTLLGGAAAAATPGVVHLTAALAPAAGALTVLPAALGAVKAATGTFKLAVAGVGDAISTGFTGSAKEAKKALEELPPTARTFAKSIIELKPQVEGLRKSVSGRFFAPLQDEVKATASRYLPLLKTGMSGVAGSLGGLGEEFARTARKADTMQGVKDLFKGTELSVKGLRGSVGPVTAALSALIQTTAPELPKLAAGFTNISKKVGGFIVAAVDSGRVNEIYDNAIATLKDLGAIAGNVGSILGSVFSAATAGGNSLLTNLRNLTGQAAAFLKSGDGTSALGSIFSTLGTLGESLRSSLGAVLPAVAQSITAIAPAVGGLAPVFAQLVVAAAPLLPYFTQIAATALTSLIPAVSALAGWLARNQGVLKGVAIALGLVYGAMKVAQAATVTWTAATSTATTVQKLWNSNFVVRLRVLAIDTAAMIRSAASTTAHAVATNVSRAATALWNSTFVLRLRVWAIDAAAMIRSTAATIAHTVATTASRAATALSTAAVTAFLAVKNFEYLAWLRSTAATIANTAATIGSTVAQKAAAVASRIWAAGQWLVNAALSANPIGLVIAGIAALVAVVVLAYKKNETFRAIVNAVWAAIKTAIGAVVTWFTGTAWPAIKAVLSWLGGAFQTFLLAVRTAWSGVRDAVSGGWSFIRDKIFSPLHTAITKTILGAFSTGVGAIRTAWDKVKDAAKTPVSFVVNSVLNPLIGGYNKLAGLFGTPKAPTIPGFAAGGRIPGAPSSVDNRMAQLVGPTGKALGALHVATGEFIVNARDTQRALPLLQWINSGMRGGPETAARFIGRRPVREPGDGSEGFAFAKGGLVGFLGDVWGALSDPAKAIKAPVENAISRIPGSGMFRDMLVGLGRKILGGLMGFVSGTGASGGKVGAAQAFVRSQAGKPYVWASAGPGGYDCSGIVSAAYNVLRGQSPYSHTFSTGSLPGPWFDTSRKMGPLVAGWSHPGQAPASASVGHMAGMIGGMPFESTGSRGVLVGAGARRVNQFANQAAARFSRGGLVPFGSYDSGGYLPTGLSLAHNGTGRPEPVGHDLTGGDIHLHFHGPVASRQAAEDMVVQGIKDAKRKRRIP